MKKRLKRLLRLRNSSGFTLIEVVVSCALLGILILGVMGFITPVLSSVSDKKMNARALMLSEAINNYIYSTVQNAYYVTTYSGAASSDMSGMSAQVGTLVYTGSDFPKMSATNNKGYVSMKNALSTLGADRHEIRCLGVRWREDPSSGEKKLMLTREQIDDKGSIIPSKTELVFDECFYDDLYPIITFENYTNQYQVKDKDTDKYVDKIEADKVNIAPALGLTVDVYTTLDCYNVDKTARDNAMVNTHGTSYVGFINIKSTVTNTNGTCEIVPNIEINSYDGARGKEAGKQYTAEGKTYYYPETFIYYIVHKSVQN